MSSIVRKQTKSGVRYDIQLSPNENPSRPKIALGRVTKDDARTVKTHVQRLVRHKMGAELPLDTQLWLAGIPESLRDRLESLELAEPRNKGKSYTVESWCKAYIAMRKNDKRTKADTIRKMENVSRRLSAFFRNTPLHEVNTLQGENFKAYLTGTVGLSENTGRKHIAISRQFFAAAIKNRLITENPFKGQAVTVRANKSRFFYVTAEMARKVLDACPDAQWRLIFGLARFGGLRCPSEILRLKWEDIDFEKAQFTVHASKTEHHADGGIRTVPMFPELKPLFQDAFDEAKEGAVYCVTRYRDKAVNLRTTMKKIIKRAGVTDWPKTFQNLRSTRETELFKLTNGNIKAVCEWIGNTPAVAMQHYAQITEADMQEAAKMAVMNDAEKKVQDRVQTKGTPVRTNSHEESRGKVASPLIASTLLQNAKACESLRNAGFNQQMGPAGLEPATNRL